jgi:hypothetical protein
VGDDGSRSRRFRTRREVQKKEEGVDYTTMMNELENGNPDCDILRKHFRFDPVSGQVVPGTRYPHGDAGHAWFAPEMQDISNPRRGEDNEHNWDRRRLGRAVKAAFLYRDFWTRVDIGGGRKAILDDDQAAEFVDFVLEHNQLTKRK